jgi:hypothetical protein
MKSKRTKSKEDTASKENKAAPFSNSNHDHQQTSDPTDPPAMEENKTVAGSNLTGPNVTITRVILNERPTSEG